MRTGAFTLAEGAAGLATGVGVPLVVMIIWGVFRVDGDPGPAPMAIPGVARLALEVVVFAFSGYALSTTLGGLFGAAYLAAVVAQYLVSLQRLRWLIRQPPR